MSFEDRDEPCGICQSSAFVWGEPKSDGGVWFRPEGTAGVDLGDPSTLTGGYGMVVRVCQGCGNVQWFLKYYPDPEKKKNE